MNPAVSYPAARSRSATMTWRGSIRSAQPTTRPRTRLGWMPVIIAGIDRRVTLLGENAQSNTAPRSASLVRNGISAGPPYGGVRSARIVSIVIRIRSGWASPFRAAGRNASSEMPSRMASRSNPTSIRRPAIGISPHTASVTVGRVRDVYTARATNTVTSAVRMSVIQRRWRRNRWVASAARSPITGPRAGAVSR